jgi:hypothetical protein
MNLAYRVTYKPEDQAVIDNYRDLIRQVETDIVSSMLKYKPDYSVTSRDYENLYRVILNDPTRKALFDRLSEYISCIPYVQLEYTK